MSLNIIVVTFTKYRIRTKNWPSSALIGERKEYNFRVGR